MPQINILNVLQGDNQTTLVDKINYNFDQILSSGGGPQGQQGLLGPTGAVGPQGPQGVQGAQGPSGTKWFVQETAPEISGITGGNPWTFPTLGDYWLDPDSANQDIYVFTATGWINTGYGLNAGELFQKVTPLNIIGGTTGPGILIAGAGPSGATATTIILSDASVSDYTPGGTAIDNVNFEGAKLKIATRNDRTSILSFGRSDLDITSGTGSTGYLKNTTLDWDSSNPLGPNFYDISLKNPGGAIGIRSTSPSASGGINLFSNGEITAQSTQDNIILKTTANKGTFIDAVNISGFLELSNQGAGTPVNNSNAPLFANSIGVGLGLGTGQFKQTGDDSRRLSVNGNISVSKTLSSHTSNLFTGTISTPNFNNGVLFVEGHSMFGHTNPTGDNSGGIQTTGPSEAQGRYPQLFVASPNYGPGVQIKTKGINYSPRTIIGDGLFDGSGTGPSITQEFFAGTGYNFGGFNQPLISYTHKISNISNSGASGPVFSITTLTNGGAYNYSTAAHRTLIETKNSNKRLVLMANGTSGENIITTGVLNSSLLSIYGASGATSGGVSVGVNSDVSPVLSALTGSNFITGNSNRANNEANHSLYVTGVQTIGTSNPQSLFNTGGTGSSALVGGNSLLKIARNLYSSTFTSGTGGLTINAGGSSINNYPNGLEITSYIPSSLIGTKGANKSVAISVGSSPQIVPPLAANTTGFFVSDTGENIAIGQYIDDTAAIGVSGAGADYAIKAKGAVGVTGNMQVFGNVSATGNTILNGNTNTTGGSLTIGNGGTPVKKMIAGSVLCPINGAATTVLRGSGFTAVMTASGSPASPNTARVQINFTIPFSTSNLVCTSSIYGGTPSNAGIGVFNFGTPATTDHEFIFAGVGTGTVTLDFIIQEVS
jgi:hypothetical protein